MASKSAAATTVPSAPCGKHGLVLPRVGLGTMGMTAFYGVNPVASEAESLATIGRALELGCNHLDTAWIYQCEADGVRHFNETLVGKALAKFGRDKFIVATKFGVDYSRAAQGKSVFVSDEASIRAMLEQSLQRLGTSYVDLYYQHRQDPAVPIEDVARVLNALREEGKIRYIGFSEVTAAELRRAAAVCPVSVIQMEYSLQSREIEASVLPAARELGIGIVAYSPLGRGLLSRAIAAPTDFAATDVRKNFPRFSAENLEKNSRGVEQLEVAAAARGIAPATLALAWVLHQGEDIFPIPGSKAVARLEQNLAAAHVALTQAEASSLADAVGVAVGGRYPAATHGSTFENRDKLTGL